MSDDLNKNDLDNNGIDDEIDDLKEDRSRSCCLRSCRSFNRLYSGNNVD